MCNINLKSKKEIEKMRIAGRLSAEVLEMIEKYVVLDITTEELNKICHDYIINVQKAIPAPLNYQGFPKSICTSVNNVVCHGIPSNNKLKKGDILNIDVTVIKNGFHGDSSKMFVVGGKKNSSIISQRLIEVTYQCLLKAIDIVKPGNTFLDIANVIEKYAKKHNFSIVEQFCGHGIGKQFHEAPQVLHYVPKIKYNILKTIFKPGMTFTIEPMLNVGNKDVKILSDGWTVVTKDHSLSAQWEHTVCVNNLGCEILTKRSNEVI